MAIGAGLITTWEVNTGSDKWIGYQVMFGFGMGLCFQTPNLATQTALPKSDVPMGMALMFFGQLLGAAVFVSVGENVLANQLIKRLSGVPGFSKTLITQGGATQLIGAVGPQYRNQVLTGYNEALRKVFQTGLILSCLTVAGVARWSGRVCSRSQEMERAPRLGKREQMRHPIARLLRRRLGITKSRWAKSHIRPGCSH